MIVKRIGIDLAKHMLAVDNDGVWDYLNDLRHKLVVAAIQLVQNLGDTRVG